VPRKGTRDALHSLLKQHVDVNAAQGRWLRPALAGQLIGNDLEEADLLLAAGANVNAANDYGVTPLCCSMRQRQRSMVENC